MTAAERNRVGGRLLWLSLMELFRFRFMQTDPNWSNFLYAPRTLQLSLIDFGACQAYDAHFADEYLRLVRACAEGHAAQPAAHDLGLELAVAWEQSQQQSMARRLCVRCRHC